MKSVNQLILELSNKYDIDTRTKAAEQLEEREDPASAQAFIAQLESVIIPDDEDQLDFYFSVMRTLGSLEATEAVTILKQILVNSEQPGEIRAEAALQLGRIGDKRAVDAIIMAVQNDDNCDVRWMAMEALAYWLDVSMVPMLINTLKDETSQVRAAAADYLGRLGDKRAIPSLTTSLNDDDDDVRACAEASLDMLNTL